MAGLGAQGECPPDTPEVPAFPDAAGDAYSIPFKLRRAVVLARQCEFDQAAAEINWASREVAKLRGGQNATWTGHIAVANSYLQHIRGIWAGAQAGGPNPANVGPRPPVQGAPLPSYLFPGSAPEPSAADKFLALIGWDQTGGTAPAPAPSAPSARQALQAELERAGRMPVVGSRDLEVLEAARRANAASAQQEALRRQIEEVNRQQALAVAQARAYQAKTQEADRARWLAKVQAAQRAGVRPPPRPPMPSAVIPPPPMPPLNYMQPSAARQAGVPRWVWITLTLGALSAATYWAVRRRRS